MFVIWNTADPESRKFIFPEETATVGKGSYFVSVMVLLSSNSITAPSLRQVVVREVLQEDLEPIGFLLQERSPPSVAHPCLNLWVLAVIFFNCMFLKVTSYIQFYSPLL